MKLCRKLSLNDLHATVAAHLTYRPCVTAEHRAAKKYPAADRAAKPPTARKTLLLNLGLLPKPFKAGLMLTTRQEAVLTHAYLNGYFRQLRPAPVSALAREFGVSTPAYTETLRRALAKLVAHTLSARGSSKLKLRIA
jgi:predicted DNA binding protein